MQDQRQSEKGEEKERLIYLAWPNQQTELQQKASGGY